MSTVEPVAAATPIPATVDTSLRYAWFVVGILMVAYVFSFIDRQILSLLVAPIRKDLGITDFEISLIGGPTFALFYTIMGIPLGRMADRGSRRGLITAGVIVWSAMTAACGLASKFWHLFLARVGVGVGEAALSPAAYSMIADYFPPEKRGTAMSVYSMGIYIGSGIASLLGGVVITFALAHGPIHLPLLGETKPWQVVFFIIGIAGVLFSAAFLLVREPPRKGPMTGQVPLAAVMQWIGKNRRTVLCHNFGFAFIAFASYGTAFWIPTYFARTFGWSIGQAAYVFGLIAMFAGSGGIVFGGWLSDRLRRRGVVDAPMRVGRWAALSLVPFTVIYLLAPDAAASAALLVPATFCIAMPFGCAPAAIQEIMPNSMRGQASAIYLFVVNLVGLGLGPPAIGALNDFVFHDDQALRFSMAIVGAVGGVMAVFLLSWGLPAYRASIERVRTLGSVPD